MLSCHALPSGIKQDMYMQATYLNITQKTALTSKKSP
jgi:hypothetical protein